MLAVIYLIKNEVFYTTTHRMIFCVCLRGKGNYSIRFVKRQANKCVHVLAKHACFNASLYESFVIPSWLEEVIISDLLSI